MIPFRPRSRLAIDRTGDKPGAGRRTGRVPAGCLGHAKSSAAEAAADRPQRRSEGDARPRARPARRRQPQRLPPRRPRRPAPALRRRSRPRRASMPPCRRRASRWRRPRWPRPSSTSQADKDALENVIELVRKQQARRRHAGAGRDLGSGRAQARRMADPAQRQQRRIRRALSRLRLRQSELAVADLPAPAHRGRAVGRPPRRRHGVVVVRERIADFGQGQVRAGEGDDRARRPRQCRTAGARGLAQRRHVGRHRERGARHVRRAADGGRPQGADGHAALRHRAGSRRHARRQAARLGPCRAGQGAHCRQQEGLQPQGAARCGAARAAQRPRLHVRQDPVAAPRREIHRGRAADAERRRRIRTACTISTNGGSSGACWRARCSTSANTAPPI